MNELNQATNTIIKKELNPYKTLLARAFYKCIPITVQIELTRKCNIKCKFCYNPNEAVFIKSDFVKSFLIEAAELGSFYLALTGGEPLLHPDFFNISKFAKDLGFLIIIQTNGVLINEKIIKKISNLNPAYIDISLHGANAETHDSITQVKGSFDKTLSAIKLLKEAGCLIRIKTPITKINQEEIEKMQNIADTIEAPIVFDPFISPTINGDSFPLELKPKFEKLSKYYEYTIFENESDIINSDGKKLEEPICAMGRSLISINAYGDILPCIRVPIPVANIYKDKFKEVWLYNEKLKELRNITRALGKKCKNCKLIDYCFLCPGLMYLNKKDFTEPYPEACKNAALRKGFYNNK